MQPTVRLYWDQPLLLAFEEPLVALAEHAGRRALVLARTAFYPESGGQLADRGAATWLAGGREVTAPVVDAQVDEAGRVLHVVDAPPDAPWPAPGDPVRVTVDEARRRLHLSLHTGQHMLSRALLDVAGAETISSRLGETVCTVDTPLARLPDEAVADAEDLVARVVLEDRPVRSLYPTPDELARLPLRRDPKVSSGVRVVEVDGFDLSPCGGTHVERTGQVGALHVVGVERYKGGHRVTFHAGRRALADYAAKDAAVRALTRALSCGVETLPAALERLQADLREERRAAGGLRAELARARAAELLAAAEAPAGGGPRLVVEVLEGATVELLRAVAAGVAEAPDALAVLAAPGEGGVHVVVQRGEAVTVDAGALLGRLAAATGGRGGGRPARAEGRLPAGADLAAALADVRARAGG